MGSERKPEWRTLSGLPLPPSEKPISGIDNLSPAGQPPTLRHTRNDVSLPVVDDASIRWIFER